MTPQTLVLFATKYMPLKVFLYEPTSNFRIFMHQILYFQKLLYGVQSPKNQQPFKQLTEICCSAPKNWNISINEIIIGSTTH